MLKFLSIPGLLASLFLVTLPGTVVYCQNTLPPPTDFFNDVLACLQVSSEPTEQCIGPIARRFVGTKPTVSITYNADYRLLGIAWKRVAGASILTTEGVWTSQNGDRVPACLMEMTLGSPDQTDHDKSGKAFFRTQIISVLTMPDLDTLAYTKETRELVKPLFKKARHVSNVQFYEIEGSNLCYISKDYLSGTLSTNLPAGATDLLKQGQQISSVMKVISAAYCGKSEMLTPDSDFRMYMNVDGKVQSLVATTRKTRSPVLLGDTRPECLEVVIEPAKDAPIEKRYFAMCVASFRDVARSTGNDALMRLADSSIESSMIPLSVDHALALGYMRCWIQAISCTNRQYSNYLGHP